MRYINGKQVTAKWFAFDGCHKIYLIESRAEYDQMVEWDYQIFHIADLPSIWVGTCPLRFIDSADLETLYVKQCEPAHFKGWQISERLQRELDELAAEQEEANIA